MKFISRLATTACVVALCTGCGNPDSDYQKAFQSDAVGAYQSVLRKYPDHPRAKEATARLGLLLWNAAKEKREIAAVKSLIRSYPKAEFTADAEALLDDLSWEAARTKNTEKSYSDYASALPKGKHVAEANSTIEDIAWQGAFDAESIESLNAFLRRFPQSARKSDAAQRIKYLQQRKYAKIFEKDDLEAFKKLDFADLAKIEDSFGGAPLLVAADTSSPSSTV